jgi:hypothetical protein
MGTLLVVSQDAAVQDRRVEAGPIDDRLVGVAANTFGNLEGILLLVVEAACWAGGSAASLRGRVIDR